MNKLITSLKIKLWCEEVASSKNKLMVYDSCITEKVTDEYLRYFCDLLIEDGFGMSMYFVGSDMYNKKNIYSVKGTKAFTLYFEITDSSEIVIILNVTNNYTQEMSYYFRK